ncbi:MAG: hypothetical protein RIT28_705 [Pseudomonadota bacterium]|jgi:hypothetical protein
MRFIIPHVVFIPFTIFSVFIVADQGFWALIEAHKAGWGLQVFLDLVIAATISLTYIVPEAKQRGINPWPYVVGTVLLGSISLLAYLIHRALIERRAAAA